RTKPRSMSRSAASGCSWRSIGTHVSPWRCVSFKFSQSITTAPPTIECLAGRHRTAHGEVAKWLSARRPVSRVLSRPGRSQGGDDHPSPTAGYPAAHAADPRAGQRASPPANRGSPSYLALLRVELAAFHSGGRAAGIVTVALVLASRRTGVTRYPALWSSDFPHPVQVALGRRGH